jgi:hypothetical protein
VKLTPANTPEAAVKVFVTALMLLPDSAFSSTVSSLRVMTYNIYLGGAQYGPLSRTVGVIRAACGAFCCLLARHRSSKV